MIVTQSTPLIRPYGPKGMEWPVYLADARRAFPNVSFSLEQDESQLEPFGYFPLHLGVSPVGDVVTQIEPKLIDGKWTRQYEARDYTEEELATRLRQAKDTALAELDRQLQAGYDEGFLYELDADTLHHFSLTRDNQQLMTGLHILAVQEGNADRVFRLRTIDNTTVTYTGAQLVAMTTAMMEHVYSELSTLWTTMDAITAATDMAALEAVLNPQKAQA